MNDLVQFLRDRYDEDHEAARLALGGNLTADLQNGKPVPRWELQSDGTIRDSEDPATPRAKGTWIRQEHIVRHDPARVLADIEAKRRLLKLHRSVQQRSTGSGGGVIEDCHVCGHFPAQYPCLTLRLLALPYADHSDYQETWKP